MESDTHVSPRCATVQILPNGCSVCEASGTADRLRKDGKIFVSGGSRYMAAGIAAIVERWNECEEDGIVPAGR